MALTENAFKKDADGDYVEMEVGETKDFAHDLADQMTRDSDTVGTPTWEADTGVTVTSPSVVGAKVQAFLTCSAAGAKSVKCTIPTTGGRTYIEKFRVIGKA